MKVLEEFKTGKPVMNIVQQFCINVKFTNICMDTIAASIAAQNTPNNITKHMQLAKYPAVGPKEN